MLEGANLSCWSQAKDFSSAQSCQTASLFITTTNTACTVIASLLWERWGLGKQLTVCYLGYVRRKARMRVSRKLFTLHHLFPPHLPTSGKWKSGTTSVFLISSKYYTSEKETFVKMTIFLSELWDFIMGKSASPFGALWVKSSYLGWKNYFS